MKFVPLLSPKKYVGLQSGPSSLEEPDPVLLPQSTHESREQVQFSLLLMERAGVLVVCMDGSHSHIWQPSEATL